METVSHDGKGGSTVGLDMISSNTIAKKLSKTEAANADSDPARIIIPDPTAPTVNSGFYTTYHRLLPILQKDSPQEFLHFFKYNMYGMSWDMVTPETLLHMILENSMRCAKVVLEGQAPELLGFRAYPNCVNQYGYFPLHQAAEMFSVDMIKLLLRHGASANLETLGGKVAKGLLPLHVAVENTCMHKYLDDNICPRELYPIYSPTDIKDVYKLIHLLCLPQMKMFMDTTKLLAEHTNNLVDEICKYIRQGKLMQTAVVLLAAQEHIRRGCSSKRNGNNKPNGFSTIIKYIAEHAGSMKLENVNRETEQQQQLKEKYILSTLWLVEAISVAGQDLGACIRGNSKVPGAEVLERVSSILKSYDFCPGGEGISIESLNLSRYDCPVPSGMEPSEHGNGTAGKVATEMPHLHAGKRIAAEKKVPKGLALQYTRKCYFPYWRSALASGFPVKIYPSYAIRDKFLRDVEYLCRPRPRSKSMDKESSLTPNHNISTSMLSSTKNYQQKRLFSSAAVTSNYQSKQLFGIAAFTSNNQSKRLFGNAALMLLKVLKKA
ncbi:hypothetical protein ACP70R_028263 [Stipagrostis hirtigluma subsp. patula]